ncbi:phosphotransferase [Streptomyces griseiscabiei]|uniref:Phosphotransferase n=1 Tax=Streptomyces griseiscabiei TaxID=2993540 RepID=A0ABU4LI05_9ACTN|nr:phosphotransferase [Streptomyces griseiscabiei]MBZ3907873.1 phosphotransferase [Streptomyces griseiscabiei]MDX2915243.1 phosphotransferase [Streptomyces griseiscabiei]
MARFLHLPPGTLVSLRIQLKDVRKRPVVIRTWTDEREILWAVGRKLRHVPRCLYKDDTCMINTYAHGVPLSRLRGNGRPEDPGLVDALCGLLVQTATVPPRWVPRRPPGWPTEKDDSQGFLRTLAGEADRQIREPNWAEYGSLFEALGVPEDALRRLAGRVPSMTRRRSRMLHGDLHPGNVIVSSVKGPPLICLDWELALYGDPLHDLATHLVRTKYPQERWDQVIASWERQMRDEFPAAVAGLHEDLRHYVNFERAQSVFPDVIRAVGPLEPSGSSGSSGSMENELPDRISLDAAVGTIGLALAAAEDPLELRKPVLDQRRIERVVTGWLAGRRDGGRGVGAGRTRAWGGAGVGARVGALAGLRAGAGRRGAEPVVWVSDPRVPERADFPRGAVTEVLGLRREAPARRVFTDTAHVNTIVRSQEAGRWVLVRGRRPGAAPLERGHLSEHAVLRFLEDSKARVEAPLLLASGETARGERFSVQTWAGDGRGGVGVDERNAGAPYNHPERGLDEREADALVDQLVALRWTNGAYLDPTMWTPGHFYATLLAQFLAQVGGFPEETRQLAKLFGLPDAESLGRSLGRFMAGRPPVLLHGDLRPQKLVRRDDESALTLVGWERALVGDPLYDLARHHHLTPTDGMIRDRMLCRWASRMDGRYTADMYEDYDTYRRLEAARSAYLDLHRLVTGAEFDVPHVRRTAGDYVTTLSRATSALGLLDHRNVNPYLTLMLR